MSLSPYRWHVDRFVASHLPRGPGLVGLDVGGPSPQERPRAQSWVSLNLLPMGTHVGSVEDLSRFPPGVFHVIQCTDMIYLVADPRKALREMRTVLRQDGVLIMTAPFLWPPSGPCDWGRWTRGTWEAALRHAGFYGVTIQPMGSAWTLIEQVVHDWLDWWPPIFCRLDRAARWPLVYGIVARP